MLRNSQNSPSPVAPSPIDTYVTSSSCTDGRPGGGPPSAGNRLDASAQPAAWRHCVPVALEPLTMCSDGLLQCDGIMRPPEAGSSFEPTAASSISYGRHAQHERERAIAIVGEEPVVAGLERHAGRHENRFVPGAADLEEDLALVLELDFLVVEPSRQHHPAICGEEIVAREAFVGLRALPVDRMSSCSVS